MEYYVAHCICSILCVLAYNINKYSVNNNGRRVGTNLHSFGGIKLKSTDWRDRKSVREKINWSQVKWNWLSFEIEIGLQIQHLWPTHATRISIGGNQERCFFLVGENQTLDYLQWSGNPQFVLLRGGTGLGNNVGEHGSPGNRQRVAKSY